MSSFIDITGQRFGQLVIQGRASDAPVKYGNAYRIKWLANCDCGGHSIVRGDALKAGTTVSCGCVAHMRLAEHRDKHGLCGSQTYHAWQGMHSRCYRQSHPSFDLYGGRGIKVCERWHSFEPFVADMGIAPDGLSLDRWPNNDGDYEHSNCRWATDADQARNRRSNLNLTWQGETLCLTDWACRLGMNVDTLYARVARSKWPIERAFTRPVSKFGDRKPRGMI